MNKKVKNVLLILLGLILPLISTSLMTIIVQSWDSMFYGIVLWIMILIFGIILICFKRTRSFGIALIIGLALLVGVLAFLTLNYN